MLIQFIIVLIIVILLVKFLISVAPTVGKAIWKGITFLYKYLIIFIPKVIASIVSVLLGLLPIRFLSICFLYFLGIKNFKEIKELLTSPNVIEKIAPILANIYIFLFVAVFTFGVIVQIISFLKQLHVFKFKRYRWDNFSRYQTLYMSIILLIEGYSLDYLFHISPIVFSVFYAASLLELILYSIRWIKNFGCIRYDLLYNRWKRQSCPNFYENDVENIINDCCLELYNSDENTKKFTTNNMPYGRATAFISYFDKSLDYEEPLYFSAIPASEHDDLRENGWLVTTKGIYIFYESCKTEIPFNDLWYVSTELKSGLSGIKFLYEDKKIEYSNIFITLPLESLKKFVKQLIEKKITLAITTDKVTFDNKELSYEDKAENFEELLKRENDLRTSVKINENIGLAGANVENAKIYGEVKNHMNGSRGNGYGAEYGNALMDRLFGKKVDNLAQQLENGHQVKNGADKSVQNLFSKPQQIQTKYYQTASESIGACFEHKQAIYLNPDGSMMKIEVPRDQYFKALKCMEKRINNGEVPGAKPGDDPSKYVKKGFFTYEQSFNLTRSLSLESIGVDVLQGSINAIGPGAITSILTFVTAVWNGKDLKDAARISLISGTKVMGKSALIFTATMQLSRNTIINPFVPKLYNKDGKFCRGFDFVENPVAKLSNNLADSIKNSNVAKSSFGKALKLDKVTGKALISGTITTVVVFGPDLCRAFQGKISTKQLFKNSAISGAGLAGAALGQLAIPIPYLGGIIGGGISSFIAKKVLDKYIEDDAVEMFQIIKEEFLDVVMLYSLSTDEFNEVIDMTIANKDLPKIMQNMFKAEDSRLYAREAIITQALNSVLNKRPKITDKMIEEGFQLLLEECTA